MTMPSVETETGVHRMTTDHAPLEDSTNGAVELRSPHHAAHVPHPRVSGRLRRRVMIGLLVFLGLGGAITARG